MKVKCPDCRHEGELGDSLLIPVWEDVDETDGDPDHLGCIACGTMVEWEDAIK